MHRDTLHSTTIDHTIASVSAIHLSRLQLHMPGALWLRLRIFFSRWQLIVGEYSSKEIFNRCIVRLHPVVTTLRPAPRIVPPTPTITPPRNSDPHLQEIGHQLYR